MADFSCVFFAFSDAHGSGRPRLPTTAIEMKTRRLGWPPVTMPGQKQQDDAREAIQGKRGIAR
jgi:hypothetical protein